MLLVFAAMLVIAIGAGRKHLDTRKTTPDTRQRHLVELGRNRLLGLVADHTNVRPQRVYQRLKLRRNRKMACPVFQPIESFDEILVASPISRIRHRLFKAL
jgi:hypothetical protein